MTLANTALHDDIQEETKARCAECSKFKKKKNLRPDDRDGKQYCKVCWAKGGFKFCKECGAFAKGHKEAKGEKTRYFFCDACWLSFEDKTNPQKTKAAKKAKREGNPKNVTDPQPCAPPTASEVRVVLTVPSDPPQELPPTTLQLQELQESVGVSENLSKTAQLSSRKPVISMMSQPVAPQSENTPPAPFNDLTHTFGSDLAMSAKVTAPSIAEEFTAPIIVPQSPPPYQHDQRPLTPLNKRDELRDATITAAMKELSEELIVLHSCAVKLASHLSATTQYDMMYGRKAEVADVKMKKSNVLQQVTEIVAELSDNLTRGEFLPCSLKRSAALHRDTIHGDHELCFLHHSSVIAQRVTSPEKRGDTNIADVSNCW